MIGLLLSMIGGMLLESGECRSHRNLKLGEGKIKVTVVVILACDKDGPIDRPLRKIAKEIQRFEKELKCFRLKSMKCKSLPVGEAVEFPLIEKQHALIMVKQTADKKNRVVVAVKPPKQNQFQYRTVCGKFLPIVTRYHTKNGERLILAIRVQPCRDD